MRPLILLEDLLDPAAQDAPVLGGQVLGGEYDHRNIAPLRIGVGRPTLILLDLMMPVMDGFEFTSELRKIEAWREVPVIVCTAKDLTAEERARLSDVVEGILEKSACGVEEIMGQIRSILATQ